MYCFSPDWINPWDLAEAAGSLIENIECQFLLAFCCPWGALLETFENCWRVLGAVVGALGCLWKPLAAFLIVLGGHKRFLGGWDPSVHLVFLGVCGSSSRSYLVRLWEPLGFSWRGLLSSCAQLLCATMTWDSSSKSWKTHREPFESAWGAVLDNLGPFPALWSRNCWELVEALGASLGVLFLFWEI